MSGPLSILYQDEHLVGLEKPAGFVVHRMPGLPRDAPLLLQTLRDQLGQRVYPVHRLDRQTSGVMVFALSSEVASKMSEHVRAGLWKKRYLALCRGPMKEFKVAERAVPDGDARREARTDFEPLETFCGRYTLTRALPHTGRRHQIRYHLKHLRHPLVGDANYGVGVINRFFRGTFALQRHFLHAEWLRLPHPFECRDLELSAALPEELMEVLAALREYKEEVP
ncbi:MAG: hypothetical protein JRH20_10455 [Deltaproteobacteria bacterium]|nr:hypothetical protein [Deltaproteobacteria bacterium]